MIHGSAFGISWRTWTNIVEWEVARDEFKKEMILKVLEGEEWDLREQDDLIVAASDSKRICKILCNREFTVGYGGSNKVIIHAVGKPDFMKVYLGEINT